LGLVQISEPIFDGGNDAIQETEVAVVETQPTREFPDPFNGIQVWAIWWQEVQAKLGSLLVAPLQMEFGAMVLCVVADGHHPAAAHGTGL
jgi:hypothetical protein